MESFCLFKIAKGKKYTCIFYGQSIKKLIKFIQSSYLEDFLAKIFEVKKTIINQTCF